MNNGVVRPGAAAASVVAGMATLGLIDNFVPFITPTGSLWQFHLIRGVMALAILSAVAALGYGVVRPRRVFAVLGRSLFQAGAMLIYFGCLAFLPIGVVVAGLFTSPMFVLLISVVFQRRHVGPVRWAAVGIGFVGALLVIRPDPAALDPVAFLPILAGLFYAIGAVATRAWCEGETTLTLSAGFFGMLAVFGALGIVILPGSDMAGPAGFVLRDWSPLTPAMWFWITVQAVGSLVGIGLIFRGYLLGDASHVAVFEYALLIFASFWAWILWDQSVGLLTLTGMAMIGTAGALIALRSTSPVPLRGSGVIK